MPIGIDVAFASTSSSLVTDDTWVSLVGGPLTVIGLGFKKTLQAYVLGMEEHTMVRFVIDGTEVVKAPPEFPLFYVYSFAIGTHTVDFQAKSEDETEQAGPRGFTVMDTGIL